MCPEVPTGKVGRREATLSPCLGSCEALPGRGGGSRTSREQKLPVSAALATGLGPLR